MQRMERDLEAHMMKEGAAYGDGRALCGDPDAYIVERKYSLDPDTESHITCGRCLITIAARRRNLKADAAWHKAQETARA